MLVKLMYGDLINLANCHDKTVKKLLFNVIDLKIGHSPKREGHSE
jgi:hypothetical protein